MRSSENKRAVELYAGRSLKIRVIFFFLYIGDSCFGLWTRAQD
jgi:hypothetical protein